MQIFGILLLFFVVGLIAIEAVDDMITDMHDAMHRDCEDEE